MTRDVWQVVRRRRWLIVIPIVVVFALPTAATLILRKSYVSQGTLQVVPNTVIDPVVATLDQKPNGPARQPVDDALDDAKLVLASRSYLTEVAVRSGQGAALSLNPDTVLASLKSGATVLAASPELMVLQFRAKDPLLARRVAQAELETILAERQKRVADDAQAAATLFSAQVDQYSKNLESASDALRRFQNDHPEVALTEAQKSILTELSVLRAQVAQVRIQEQNGTGNPDQLHQQEATLLAQINNLAVPVGATPDVQLELLRLTDVEQAAQTALDHAAQQFNDSKLLASVHREQVGQDRILDPASLPTRPARGKALTLATLAFVVAAAAATSLVLLAEHLDDKVRRSGDVTAAAGLAVLAVVEAA